MTWNKDKQNPDRDVYQTVITNQFKIACSLVLEHVHGSNVSCFSKSNLKTFHNSLNVCRFIPKLGFQRESIAGEISNKSKQSCGLGHTSFFLCCSFDFFGELFFVEGDKFQNVASLARPEKLN